MLSRTKAHFYILNRRVRVAVAVYILVWQADIWFTEM